MNLDTFKKKRTADEAFKEYEYVYGIIITGEKMTLVKVSVLLLHY